MNRTFAKISIVSATYSVLLVPALVRAQAVFGNPIDASFSTLPSVLYAILDVLLIFAVPVIIFFIVYAGFLYVTAQGNPNKISDANKMLFYGLIGGVIVLGARIIGGIIESTVGQITPP